jgi:four helix bundle protein
MSQMNPEQQILHEHSLRFALAVREFGKVLPMTVSNVEDLKQLIRASGAIGERYIVAHTAATKHDYLQGLRACGAEAHNTWYWLQLVDTQGSGELEAQRERLKRAAQELMSIFQRMLQTSK